MYLASSKYPALMVALLSLCSCATIVSGTSRSVNISTDPPGAIVSVQGKELRTPGDLSLSRAWGNSLTGIAVLAGYENEPFELKSEFEPWFLGNILFGGLIGMGVDWATGSIRDYEDRIHIVMYRPGEVRPPPPPDPSSAPAPVPTYPSDYGQ